MMATIDSKEYQEHIKCMRIEKVVDSLKEEAYLSDLYIEEEDNYDDFFEQLYIYFETNGLLNFYLQAMNDFISKCIIEKKTINIQLLIADLDKLKCINCFLPNNKQFGDEEISHLKEMMMLSKRKSFSLNQLT